jgi:large subunit ribosomal protein L6
MKLLNKNYIWFASNFKFKLNNKYKNSLIFYLLGPLGYLSYNFHKTVLFKQKKNILLLSSPGLGYLKSSFKIIINGLLGLSIYFKKTIQIVGIGFYLKYSHKQLFFKLGYSHFITIQVPKSIQVVACTPNTLTLKSTDLHKLTQFIATIFLLKNVDLYKGKGIFYKHQKLALKIGKKNLV